MGHVNLEVQGRSETGKGPNRRLRAEGRVPAVVYGKGIETVLVSVLPRPVVDALNGEYGRNTVFDLQVEDGGPSHTVIMRDFQLHPWRRTLEHIDFWAIGDGTELVLDVPLRREGRAALESIGGKVRQTRATVKIRCLPANIPAAIPVDMTRLTMDSVGLKVSELKMPEGVEALYKSDYKIIDVRVPKAVDALEDDEASDDADGAGDGEAGASSDDGASTDGGGDA
jgi:large subunit ribosomal protein L25